MASVANFLNFMGKLALNTTKFVVNAAMGGLIEELAEGAAEQLLDDTWCLRVTMAHKAELVETVTQLISTGSLEDILGALGDEDAALMAEYENSIAHLSDEEKEKATTRFFGKHFGKKLRKWFKEVAELQQTNTKYFTPEELYQELYSERDEDGQITTPRIYRADDQRAVLLLRIANKINLLYFELKFGSLAAEERDVVVVMKQVMALQNNELFDRLSDLFTMIIQQNNLPGFTWKSTAGAGDDDGKRKIREGNRKSISDYAKQDPFFFIPLKCPNCQSTNVTRAGDQVSCKSCGHKYLAIENHRELQDTITDLTNELYRRLSTEQGQLGNDIKAKLAELAKQQISAEFVHSALDETRDAIRLDIGEIADSIEESLGHLGSSIDKIDELLSRVHSEVTKKLAELLGNIEEVAILAKSNHAMLETLITAIAAREQGLPTRIQLLCPLCLKNTHFQKNASNYTCGWCDYAISFEESHSTDLVLHEDEKPIQLELSVINPYVVCLCAPPCPEGTYAPHFKLHLTPEKIQAWTNAKI